MKIQLPLISVSPFSKKKVEENNLMREVKWLNDNWKFIHEDRALQNEMPEDGIWVTLPHTWNAVDGHDGHAIDIPSADWSSGDLSGEVQEHYDRGAYWYYRTFETPKQPLPGGQVYLEIPAAGLMATVYVNGHEVVHHEGGFSAFRANITDCCKNVGENLLAIHVSNKYQSNVYPQHADFTFYGGLYRGVKLICVSGTHFDLDYYASDGVKVTPRPSENGAGVFAMESFVSGDNADFTIQYQIFDADGNEAGLAVTDCTDTKTEIVVEDVHLWSPLEPYLYTVKAQLLRRNEIYDEVIIRSGVRSFSCDPQQGFIFNGKPMPLRGVSRHQDLLYKGNALTREEHFRDAHIIKDLGANAIRLAHYQHSQDFYDACDEVGFVVWAEIPFITIMNKDPKAHDNAMLQMRELIIQNYNHPCICFWGLSNEVLLAGKDNPQLIENHKQLNALVKSLDRTRLTTIAHVSNTPEDSQLHDVSDVEAYNHYFGWYVGSVRDNGPWLDAYHQAHPDRCIGISEYGAEGILTYHSSQPESKDYTEEYQALYHEEMARVFAKRPWVWCSFVWNMFDFGAAARNEGGVAGRNNKGLVTMDRKIKKDAYYIYKAYWNPEPMVHICGKRYAKRDGETTQIRVYSNLPEVSLYVNGKLVETKSADKVFEFTVSLTLDRNSIVASAGKDGAFIKDTASIEKVEKEPDIYTLPSVRARRQAVTDWYSTYGEPDMEAPLAFPSGSYSICDQIGDIVKNPEGKEIMEKAMFIAMKLGEYSTIDYDDMFRKRAKETPSDEISHNDPSGRKLLYSLNNVLNQISKS